MPAVSSAWTRVEAGRVDVRGGVARRGVLVTPASCRIAGREVAQGGHHDAGTAAGADLAVVGGEGDAADPVKLVFRRTRDHELRPAARWDGLVRAQ